MALEGEDEVDSYSELDPGTGGGKVVVEPSTLPDGTAVVMPVSKIRFGEAGSRGRSVSRGSPLPSRDLDVFGLLQELLEQVGEPTTLDSRVMRVLNDISRALQYQARVLDPVSRFVRPNNTTAYTAGDAVADSTGTVKPLEWVVSAERDQPVMLSSLRIESTDTGVVSKNVRVWIFRQKPVAGAVDNVAFTVPAFGLVGTMVGPFQSSTTSGAVATCVPEAGPAILTRPEDGGTKLYGLQQTTDDFTPIAYSGWSHTLLGFQGLR